MKLLSVLFAASLVFAACGDSDSNGSSDSIEAGLVVAAVDGIRWEKDRYETKAGEVTVALDNRSSLPHNLYLIAADGTQLSASFEASAGQTTEPDAVTLAAGTYTLICKLPGHAGMKATLTVS